MTGPHRYRPGAPLSDFIEYFGYWDRRAGEPHRSRALPRGAATVVIDVGGRSQVDFYDADGCTRLEVPPAFVTGAGTTSYQTHIDAAQTVMTIHFRPAGAAPFLGIPLGELTDCCVGLNELWGREATLLRERLLDAPSAAARVAVLEAVLLTRLRAADVAQYPQLAEVLAGVEQHPSMRVADAAAVTGLSPKRLIAMFRAQVGLAPKAYLRVRRLQAALRRLDGGPLRGADLAAELGYFDQAHFGREFRSFTALTPTQYLQRRSWLPSHVELAPDATA